MTRPTSFDDPRIVQLQGAARRHVREHITPHGDAWEEAGTTPHSAFRALGAAGLLGVCHRTEDGGTDLGPIGSVVFSQEISASSYGGVAEAVLIHTDMSSTHIAHRGTPEQRKRFLPGMLAGDLICGIAVSEPEAGSDLAAMRTTARREGDGWVLDGVKTYATNAVHGDVMVVAARTDMQAKPTRGISLFIVQPDTPGLQIRPMPRKLGLHSSDIADMVFTQAKLPADCLLGEENAGFQAILQNFQNERLVLGAMAVGLGRKALQVTLSHVKSRRAFGGTLWDLQATRQRLAMLAARHEAVRSLVQATAVRVAQGHDCVREVSMVKALAGETVQDVMRECLQLHGGAGYMADCPMERMTRDARILTIGGGATEVMLEEVAKRLTEESFE
ncbi:acyl-CoA dehydrogenase family protein [Caenimonas sp. SL110]|uniref:acyl-CoA dehydrogenase family protein n=1 Tax=Caenimonas sp. SL110 TaxID=1450524 RepID=UPI00065432C1|nr:acyl-CoA dehydrogenase family protein [Caenimonas sp. SL110]